MAAVDPGKLPYPWPAGTPPMSVSGRGGHWNIAGLPGALAAGTAQCPEAYLRPGGRLKDSEGVLGFHQDWFVFYADSGRTNKVPCTGIKSYSIKRGLVLRKLTLHGTDGSREEEPRSETRPAKTDRWWVEMGRQTL